MLTLPQVFEKAFETKKLRKWEKIFVLVDIHDTIVKSDYQIGIKDLNFYPDAITALEELSVDPEICLILWSSSSTEKLQEYQTEFIKHGHMIFDYLNCNPEVTTTEIACFANKPYFNVIIDDKAGFEAEKDWTTLLTYLHAKNKL